MIKSISFVALALLALLFLSVSTPTFAGNIAGSRSPALPEMAATATFYPVADSYIDTSQPGANYGTNTRLRADASPVMISYLRFNVQGLSSAVTKAVLRLYGVSGSSTGFKVYRVGSNTWGETTINYTNSPALGTLVGSSGAYGANAWAAVDVTSYVTGNGTYSIGLTGPSSTALALGSRESTAPPQLVVASGAVSVPTATPTKQPANTPTPTAKPTSTPVSSNLLWTGTMETGDLSQWNNGGGEFDSGTAVAFASRDYAHSGAYSLKMVTTTPPESAVRMFRWHESQTYTSLYYSTWYYLPRSYSAPNYWNIMQWKSKTSTANDPFYTLNVNTSSGTKLYLYDWQRKVSYSQSAKTIPIGQWFHVQAFYKCAPDGTGQITIWQDGTQIMNVTGKSTRYSDGDCQWSVNNYSDSLSPSPATIYADDAAISQSFIP